ncbi:MAG TPA: hypothetical protein VHQ02_03260 [Usitatibacter sp.]|jgi:hypothetical protein|nr:hypothetical protein [Usitatibacter sp.]
MTRLARLAGILALAAALLPMGNAWAARTFTVLQSPATGTEFDMRSTQSVSFQVTSTASGANVGERIYLVRFRISSGSVFSGGTAAPAGWNRTAFTTTSVTFQATSWANAIPSGGSAAFAISIIMRSSTQDVSETLRDIRSSFTTTTTGPPFTSLGTSTVSNPGGWTLRSYGVTFQLTDLSGNPITALAAGTSFRLVMTVTNLTTVTQNGITASPNPPTAVKTGTVTQGLTGTTGSPLNLVSNASGSITFTYSTAAADSGTIFFTAIARNSGSITSRLATSSTLSIGRFTAAVASSLACQYAGSNITVTLSLTDGFPYSILNVTPVLAPLAGAPVTYVSGPSPAAPIASVPVSPPATNVTWTYLVNATGTANPFTFSGSASGTGNTVGSPAVATPTATSANVKRGDFGASLNPTVVNAGSSNVEVTVSITNNGCAAVTSVAITPPAGWTGSADSYSLVDIVGSSIETWTAAGVGPVTFTAPNLAAQMPLGFGGDFAVVFAATPAAAGAGNFTVRVTDANGLFTDIPLPITVNAFKSGTLNDAASRVWREIFQ